MRIKPAEVAAFVYECNKACLAMSSLSDWDCRYYLNLRFTLLVYDTSGCNSQGISWLPSYRYWSTPCEQHMWHLVSVRRSGGEGLLCAL